MRLTETPTRLTLRDTAPAVRVLGAVFVASGLLVLTAPLTMDDWATLGIWPRLAIVAIGLGHLGGGLFTVMHPARSHVELDRDTGEGVLRWLGEWRRERTAAEPARETRFRLADVRTVEVVRDTDGDGDPVFRVRLWLADGRSLPVQAHAVGDGARVTEWAERVRAFVGVAAPVVGSATS